MTKRPAKEKRPAKGRLTVSARRRASLATPTDLKVGPPRTSPRR